MRIAQVAPPWLTIPPSGYGGVEAVVGTLTEGLVQRGHDVTLFAAGPSTTPARTRSYYDQPLGTTAAADNPLLALPHVLGAYACADEFDVIHDHTFPIGPALGAMLVRPPVVHTVHTPPDDPRVVGTYGLLHQRIALVASSDAQRRSCPDLEFAAMIHNGIDVDAFPAASVKDDFLLFVGRMSPKKGAHLAVAAAARLGRRLIVATKMTDPAEVGYFEESVVPLLTEDMTVLREVDRASLAALYRDAACLLAPFQWSEPFGLSMIEAMACGTPVVALRVGAAPEIVEHGVTGFLADDLEEFIGFIPRIAELDPAACRRRVAACFSADRMVDAYETLYSMIVQ